MYTTVISDNIIKLRELTSKLCKSPDDEYKVVVEKIKILIGECDTSIDSVKSPQTKLKCYKEMHETLKNILTNLK